MHCFVQVRDCGNLLTVGGFNIPAVDVDDVTIHYKDFKGVVNHIRYHPSSSKLVVVLLDKLMALAGCLRIVPHSQICLAAIAYHCCA